MFDSKIRSLPNRQWARRCRQSLLACGLLLVLQAGHAEKPLSLDEALLAAQQRSLQLHAQEAMAAAARERAIAAAQLPDPVIKGGIVNLPISGPDRFSVTRDFMTMRSIGVMQEFTGESKLRARSSRFDRVAEVAQAGRTVALAKLHQDTAVAWLEQGLLDRLVEQLRVQRSEAGLQIEAANSVYSGGKGSQAEVFTARIAVAQIDDRIEQALHDSGAARIRLMRWVGDAGNRPLDQTPGLLPLRLDAASLDRQLEQHPQIALLSRQVDVARAEAELARANKASDWSVELMLSQRGPAYSNMMSLTFAVPLKWDPTNRQDREIAASVAAVDQAQAERDEALREIGQATRIGLLELKSIRARLQIVDTTLIPLAQQRIAGALADYRGGNGPLAVVLEARQALIDRQLDRLRLAIAEAGQWARLNYLIPDDPAERAVTEQSK